MLRTPRSFINTVPHMSFVWGGDNVNFLRARYANVATKLAVSRYALL
ncbi:hypothetical protein DMI69_14165 [Escherichia coli]|nr:hypothetical protein [Escherichia coli]